MATDGKVLPSDTLLTMELRRELPCADSEDSFLGRYEGSLLDEDTKEAAGRVRLFVVNIEGAREADIPAFDLLDSEAATAPYIELLNLREAGNFRPAVLSLLGEDMVFNQNVLIIDRVELLPEYRGRGLGLSCMAACMRHLGLGCRIAAIKPFPLQFEGGVRSSDDWKAGLKLVDFSRDKRATTARLRSYYAQIGFQHVRGTQLMVRDLHVEGWPHRGDLRIPIRSDGQTEICDKTFPFASPASDG